MFNPVISKQSVSIDQLERRNFREIDECIVNLGFKDPTKITPWREASAHEIRQSIAKGRLEHESFDFGYYCDRHSGALRVQREGPFYRRATYQEGLQINHAALFRIQLAILDDLYTRNYFDDSISQAIRNGLRNTLEYDPIG